MIQEITLPPLPVYMDSVTPEQFAERVREWGRAAVEADRRERGEPVAEVYRMHYGNRMGNIGVNAVRALLPPDDLPPPGTKLYAIPVAAQAQPVVNQQMTTDTALAATQRAIIEAAERRGYERAIAECAQDREDAERWRYVRRKMCFTGNGNGTCAMQAINLPANIPGWPDIGGVEEFCDAAIDAARAAKERA